MNLTFLSLLLAFNLTVSKTPNFYPSYIAAKEASKNYQKDLLIFFSKNTCAECESAWAAFEKDQMATKIFISTLVDAQDFDGAVILDKYGLSSTPSWVILDYEGNLKQKWTGEWKNPHVRPATPPTQETAKADVPPVKEFKATTATQKAATAPSQTASSASMPASSAPDAQPAKTTAPSTPPAVMPSVTVPAAGFVLQAGYFGSEANALKLVNDLKAKGYAQYSVKSTTQNGTPFFRVISSIFPSEAEANKEVETLSALGVKATVKKSSEI